MCRKQELSHFAFSDASKVEATPECSDSPSNGVDRGYIQFSRGILLLLKIQVLPIFGVYICSANLCCCFLCDTNILTLIIFGSR